MSNELSKNVKSIFYFDLSTMYFRGFFLFETMPAGFHGSLTDAIQSNENTGQKFYHVKVILCRFEISKFSCFVDLYQV